MTTVFGTRQRQVGEKLAVNAAETAKELVSRVTVATFEKGNIRLNKREERPLNFGEVRIAVRYISISPGTDLYELKSRDRLDAGAAGTRVGVVVEVGPGVDPKDVAVGNVIYADGFYEDQAVVDTKRQNRNSYWGHVDRRIPEAAYAYVKLGVVAFNAWRDAALRVDVATGAPKPPETLVVIGLGLIGQIATQLALIDGAKDVIVLDTQPKRVEFAMDLNRDRARAHGANLFAATNTGEVIDHLRSIEAREELGAMFVPANRRKTREPNTALDFSGSEKALNNAIEYLGVNGRLVVPAWHHGTDGLTSLSLGAEFHTGGISIISSQVGRVRPELAGWTRQDSCNVVTKLMRKRELDLASLVTQVLPFDKTSLKLCFEKIEQSDPAFIGPVLGVERHGATLMPPAQALNFGNGLND